MWASVQRGGEVFTPDARCIPQEDGSVTGVFYFAPGTLSADVKDSLRKYMQKYAKASGWNMRRLRMTNRYAAFEIAASKAASKASKKP